MDSNVNFDVHRDCKAKFVLTFSDGTSRLREVRVYGSGLVTSKEYDGKKRLKRPEVVLQKARRGK